MNRPLRIATGGSAANPPHLGHRALIWLLLTCGLFDLVIWIVSGSRKDKNIAVSPDDQATMTNLMLPKVWFTKKTRLVVRFNDVYWENTPTIVCLNELAQQYPGAQITWFTGADSVVPRDKYGGQCEIAARWVQGEELIAKWPFLVIARQGYSKPDHLPVNFTVLPAHLPDISSSQMRQLIAQDQPFEHLLTPSVARYIKRWKLYGYNDNQPRTTRRKTR